MRRKSILGSNERRDSADFEFDDLMDNYFVAKRNTEMPHVGQKVLSEKVDDVYFKEEDYILAIDDTSSKNNDSSRNLLQSPVPQINAPLNRKKSTFQKLKHLANNPETIQEKISSPERKASDISENVQGEIIQILYHFIDNSKIELPVMSK